MKGHQPAQGSGYQLCISLFFSPSLCLSKYGGEDWALRIGYLSCPPIDTLMLTWKEGSICFFTLPDHFWLFNSLLTLCLVNFIKCRFYPFQVDSFLHGYCHLFSALTQHILGRIRDGGGLMGMGVDSNHVWWSVIRAGAFLEWEE